ncbi:putative toxin-antitoxin system toxin component, PIN family [Massilia sp. erpn]|uniref:PIN domain-containing protein n=1 Tax=Massilia sp. erpn TaxID=2738142 RepID=UPI0021046BF1|nr:PIN domain-containing protein [Massilia sp. erpn]UTY57001.1 PIN domain-containing protein [Massilia sp. erpn]
MAGYYRYTAVLDACVLYPAPLRDLLLSLASEGVFRARWTDQINQEWTRNLLAKRPDLDAAKLERTVLLMNEAVEDCLVDNYGYLINSLHLPDPNDRHVLASAIVGHADAIVTFNLRDFPDQAVSPYGIEILHPDDFLIAQYDLCSIRMLSIIKSKRERLRNPPKSAEDFIATYERQGLPQTCEKLRQAIDLI